MKTRHFLQLLGPAILLSACATTSAPDDLGELVYTGFSERSDGTAYHKAMGVSCPAQIGDMARTGTYVYNDAGTDISCNYNEGGQIFTLYLSQYSKSSLRQEMQSAMAAIEYRFADEGYAYNEDLSETCSSATLDQTSILSSFAGLLSGENQTNEITINPTPAAVYTKGSDVTLVMVEEMFEKEFFKIRYTGMSADEASVEKICELGRAVYLSTEKFTREDRGLPASEGQNLQDLINASGGR